MASQTLVWIRRFVIALVLLSAVFVVVSALSFVAGGFAAAGGGSGIIVGFTTFGILVVAVMIPLSLYVVYRVLNSGMLDDF